MLSLICGQGAPVSGGKAPDEAVAVAISRRQGLEALPGTMTWAEPQCLRARGAATNLLQGCGDRGTVLPRPA